MHVRKYLAAACICCGIVAALISWWASGWKATLKRELQRGSTEDGFVFQMRVSMHAGTVSLFRLPAKAGTILEGHRREELLPYLSELQKSTDDLGEKAVILDCALVVIHGLRGTPSTVEYTLDSKPKKVSVFDYCLSGPTSTDEQKRQLSVFALPPAEEEETVASPQG